MGDTILFRRGIKANLPALQAGEPGWSEDSNQLFIGSATGSAASAMPIGDYDYAPESFTQASIEATLALIGTVNKATLLIRPGTWPIISNANWSAYTNVTFKIVPGTMISHGAFTVNIPNPDAGLYQWLSGTGAVNFSGSIKGVYPQWYGAKADGATDDVVAIQKAINTVILIGKGNIIIPPGTYATTSELFFGSASATISYINIQGYGATISSTSTGNILRVGDSGGFGANYSGIYGLRLLSTTAAVGLKVTGTNVYGCRFKDMTIEGKVASAANSTGILLYPTGGSNYMSLFEHIQVMKWDIGISIGYDWAAGTAISGVNAPNANRFQDIFTTTYYKYGLYINNTGGLTYSGDFEGSAGGAVIADIELANGADGNILNVQAESSAPAGIIVGVGSVNNKITAQLHSNSYTDNSTLRNNVFIGVESSQPYVRSLYGRFSNIRNHTVGYPLDIAQNIQQQQYFSVVTMVKSIDVDSAETSPDIDFVLNNTVANVTEQSINVGEIKPYAEIISVQLRSYETVAGSGSAVMSIDVGITSGGAELLTTADIDSDEDISTTATGASPKLGAVKTERTLWVNFTPTANWNTLTAGRWVVLITYIDYNRIKTARVG